MPSITLSTTSPAPTRIDTVGCGYSVPRLGRVASFKSGVRELMGGMLCVNPSRRASPEHFTSAGNGASASISAQLGKEVFQGERGGPHKAILKSLESASGALVLNTYGLSKQFRKQAGSNGDWGLSPCCFWVAIHARVSHPRTQFQYGDAVRKTADELIRTFTDHQPSVLAYRDGINDGLKAWLKMNGLVMWSQLPQKSAGVRTGPLEEPVVAALMRELFVSDVKGYRVVTFHGTSSPGNNATRGQQTIAIWPGSEDSAISLFDPGLGEIQFEKPDQFIHWFEEQYWPLSGNQERFRDAFNISFVRYPGADDAAL